MNMFLVGGALRDQFMKRVSNDIDIAIEAISYDHMIRHLNAMGCQIFLERPQFGTVRAKHPEHGVADFVLCRKDGFYVDHRRPESVSVGSIYDDLSRRDFTINAMARNLKTNQLIDPHGGEDDISNKIIRVVGDVEERMTEDKLRVIRAIRFSITLGFSIESNLNYFITKCKPKFFKNIASERIYEEIKKCFTYSTFKTLNTLNKYPLFYDYCFSEVLNLSPTIKTK
jgi:tRNA nucleotidyltransferase (CCA-adding enzyme)